MRPTSAQTDAAIAATVTRPVYLVYLGFDAPFRFSSRGTVDYDGELWLEASMQVSPERLRVFNEATQLGQVALTEGTAGRAVRVYQFYDSGDVILRLDGEMGPAEINATTVEIALKERPPNRTPRDFINEPTFSHLPAPGTRIETPKQTVVIE